MMQDLKTARRHDISDCLIHLTRDRQPDPFSSDPNIDAFNVLKGILQEGILKPGLGFVKGRTPAICLTETPLSSVSHLAASQPTKHRKSFYGFIFDKNEAFELGARPVIYLPDAECDWIPSEEKWRHVRYEPGKSDWTHEREWRVKSEIDLATVSSLIVLVWSHHEVKGLYELNFQCKTNIQAILPMEHLLKFL